MVKATLHIDMLNVMKAIYDKPTANIILKWWKQF